MAEKHLRKKVLEALRHMHAVSIENMTSSGVPDVNYNRGWIELKYLPRWKKGWEVKKIPLHHFTPIQRLWIRKREMAGGLTWVLIQIGTTYFLLRGMTAVNYLGDCTGEDLRRVSYRVWEEKLDGEELFEALNEYR
jgi:hypothetical protein